MENNNEELSLYDRLRVKEEELNNSDSTNNSNNTNDDVDNNGEQQTEISPVNNKPPDENNSELNKEEEEAESIYSDINNILGLNIEGDFEEDVQGFSEYVKLANQQAIQTFESNLEERYPNSYQYIMYEHNGGNPADLLQKDMSLKSNVDTDNDAVNIIKEDLLSKGLDEDIINHSIEKYKENGDLVERANKIVEVYNNSVNQQKQDMIANQEAINRQRQEIGLKVANGIGDFINKGVFENEGRKIFIPENDKKGFNDFLMENIQIDNEGQPILVHRLDNLSDLQYSFFRFKKGDLSNVVEQRKNTGSARSLRRQAVPDNNHQQTNNNSRIEIYKQLYRK